MPKAESATKVNCATCHWLAEGQLAYFRSRQAALLSRCDVTHTGTRCCFFMTSQAESRITEGGKILNGEMSAENVRLFSVKQKALD